MSRPVFKAFTNAQNFNAARGHLLDAGHAFTAAEVAIDLADCESALNDMRKGAFHLGNATKHGDFASREGGEDLDHDGLNQQSKRVFDQERETQAMFAAKCFRGAPRAKKPAEAPPAPEAKKAKAPKRLQTQKTDWLAPPTMPGEPEPFPTDVEEAIEAIQEAEAEGPRITITPARDEDGPDVAARAKLEPGEGTWAEGKKQPRKARAAREVPDELPPLTPEALAPPRKRGPRGNTRTLEYTSKSGKVCRIKISSTPNGCLLVED